MQNVQVFFECMMHDASFTVMYTPFLARNINQKNETHSHSTFVQHQLTHFLTRLDSSSLEVLLDDLKVWENVVPSGRSHGLDPNRGQLPNNK